MKNTIKILSTIIVASILFFTLSSCYRLREYEYYSDKENFVTTEGTVTIINDLPDERKLVLAFSDLSVQYSYIYFKIVGYNYQIVKENRIVEKLEIGKRISFVSATRYFGDGFVMPIVSITIDGVCLLDFEEGQKNLLDWIKSDYN